MKVVLPAGKNGDERKADVHEIFTLIKHSCRINSSFVSSEIKASIMHLLLSEYIQFPASYNLVLLRTSLYMQWIIGIEADL